MIKDNELCPEDYQSPVPFSQLFVIIALGWGIFYVVDQIYLEGAPLGEQFFPDLDF